MSAYSAFRPRRLALATVPALLNGNLYGTTYYGGSSNLGTVFKIPVISASAPEPGALALLLAPGLAVAGLVARRGYRKTAR